MTGAIRPQSKGRADQTVAGQGGGGPPRIRRPGRGRRARPRQGAGRGVRREARAAAAGRGRQAVMKVLVTGTAGFIGSHLALRLLERGDQVIGLDNLSDYYDVTLKRARLARFMDHPKYTHLQADLGPRRGGGVLRDAQTPARGASGRPGRRALRGREPARVREQQCHRLPAHPRRLPPPWRGAPGVRQHQFGLRRQHPAALFRAPGHRAPPDAVRRPPRRPTR